MSDNGAAKWSLGPRTPCETYNIRDSIPPVRPRVGLAPLYLYYMVSRTASAMASKPGTQAVSCTGEKGAGWSLAATLLTGSSSSFQVSPVTMAAIYAPTPQVRQPSSTVTSLPVLRRGGKGIPVQGGEGAWVDYLHACSLPLQRYSRAHGLGHHAQNDEDSGVFPLPDHGRLTHGQGEIGIQWDLGGAVIERLLLEEEHRVVVPDGRL